MHSLPFPEPDALKLSEKLQQKTRSAIHSEGGSISFARFMEMALYEPGLGYYSAGLAKFGAEGDFVTAPEISPFFGRCFARQISQVFNGLDHNKTILEFGAGSGRFACDILTELEALDALPESYLILEVSADLRERQQRLIAKELPQLVGRVEWLDQLPEEKINGVLLANEVLDALPVERFRISGDQILEQRVIFEDDQFRFVETRASDQLRQAVEAIGLPLADAYVSEINRNLPAWFKSLSNILQNGVIFCVDYGCSHNDYYHPDRIGGTLICHYRHRVHDDPFVYIGLQDLSTSVNFTAVAEAAYQCGFEVEGYTTQAYFLMSCGLVEMLDHEQGKSSDRYLQATQQVKMLTLPGEMGERFKVIALTKDFTEPLMGFEMNNMLERL
jgi:SAM-dependent MidA family methyltransferase